MANLHDIYTKAIAGGVLAPQVTEERFAKMLQNDKERKDFFDYAQKNKPGFYSSDYDVFSNNTAALFSAAPEPMADENGVISLTPEQVYNPEANNASLTDDDINDLNMQNKAQQMSRRAEKLQQRTDEPVQPIGAQQPTQFEQAFQTAYNKRATDPHAIAERMIEGAWSDISKVGDGGQQHKGNLSYWQSLGAHNPYPEGVGQNQDPYIRAAKSLLLQAENRMKDTRKGDYQLGDVTKNTIRHLLESQEGIASFGLSNVAQSVLLKKVFDKVNSEDALEHPETVLDKRELALFNAYTSTLAAELARAEDTSVAATTGKITADMVQFMEEMALQSGIWGRFNKTIQNKLARKLTEQLVAKASGKVVHGIAKTGAGLIMNATERGLLAGETAVTSLLLPRTYANAISNKIDVANTDNGIDFDGYKLRIGDMEEKTTADAFLTAWRDQWKEMYTETGGLFRFGTKIAFNNPLARKAFNAFGKTKVGNLLDAFGNKTFSRFAKGVAYDGVFNEWTEEVEGAAWDYLFGNDKSFSNFFSKEQQLPMILSFSLPALVGVSANASQEAYFKNKYDNAIRGLQTTLRVNGYGEEDIEETIAGIKDNLYATNIEDLPKTIHQMAGSILGRDVVKARNRFVLRYEELAEKKNLSDRDKEELETLSRFLENDRSQILIDCLSQLAGAEVALAQTNPGVEREKNIAIERARLLEREDRQQQEPSTPTYEQVVKEAEDAVSEHAFRNGGEVTDQTPVYRVTLGGDENKQGYIVSGETNPVVESGDEGQPIFTNDGVVTVKWDDGTVSQHTLRDLSLLNVSSAGERLALETEARNDERGEELIAGGEKPVLMQRGDEVKGFVRHANGILMDEFDNEYTDTQLAEEGWQVVAEEDRTPAATGQGETPQDASTPSEHRKVIPDINDMSAEEYGGALVEYAGNADIAKSFIQAEIEKANAELKKLDKQKVRNYTDLDDYIRQDNELKASRKALQDRLSKLQGASIAAANYKTQAELQAEAERKAREAEMREQRRQLAEAEAAGDIEVKWQNTKKTVGFAATKTLPNGQKVKGHYILTEAGDVIPSHDPRTNYADSEGYLMENGQNVNDNNYKDPDVQRIALDMAQNYGGQAVEQMPILENKAGRVLSGNNRTISGIIAAENNTDQAYLAALAENAQQFGFTPEQLAEYQHPRLQFVVEDELPFTTGTFAMFNQQEKKTKSSVNRAVANSKMVTEAVRDKMLEIMDQFESLDSFFGSESAAADIVQSLINEGLMTQQEVAGLTETTDKGFKFNQSGKEYVTDMLLGTLFDEDTIRMLAGEKSLKQAILRALPSIVENRRLKGYELTSSINSAIKLLYEARKANEGKSTADAFTLYLRQVDAFEGSVKDRYNGFDIILAGEMANGVERTRELLNIYNNSARDEANGQMGFFEPRDIEQIKQDVYDYYAKRNTDIAAALDGAAETGTQPEPVVQSGTANEGEERQAINPEPIWRSDLGNVLIRSEVDELINEIHDGKSPIEFVSFKNIRQVLENNGLSEKQIQSVENTLAKLGRANKRVNGFFINGINFLNSDYLKTGLDVVGVYVHERQHGLTKSNQTLLRSVSNAATIEELAQAVENLAGHNEYTEMYLVQTQNKDALADELISHVMQMVYAYDLSVEEVCKQAGLNNQEIINILNTLDNEQRNDQSLSKARRYSILSNGSQGRTGENGGNTQAQSAGGLEQQGSGLAGQSPRGTESRGQTPGERTGDNRERSERNSSPERVTETGKRLAKVKRQYPEHTFHVGEQVVYDGDVAVIESFQNGDAKITVNGHQEYVRLEDIRKMKPTETEFGGMLVDTTKDVGINAFKAAETEIGGALVDRLGDMGVDISTDLAANQQALKEAKADKSEAGKVHYFKTPSGQQYGFSYKGKVYLDPRKVNAELPLHEYGHLLAEALRIINPENWKNVVDTIKADKDAWAFVKQLRPELKDESEIAEEVIATFSGKNGAEKMRAEYERMNSRDPNYKSKWGNIFKNISKAIQDFWKAVGDFLNIRYESAEQVYDQVLKDFVDNMNPWKRVTDYLRQRDAEYVQAAESGDIRTATNLFYDALKENIGNGITPYMSVGTYNNLKALAKGVKTRNLGVIRDAARKIAPLIPDNAVLIPAPSHDGRATDMLDLANAIAEITGSEVADVLRSKPRESQYQAKKANGVPMSSRQLGITMEGTLPDGKTPIIIDNVVDSGNTAEACVQAVGRAVVVTIGDSAEQYRHAASLKSAAPILRDKNGNVIPLSKRFKLNGSRYLGRRTYLSANDPRFAISGTQVIPISNKSLVGLHNISADKLRKALKMGGLANPSAAVIDIARQDHHNYGVISLVLPSGLVEDAYGTYAGDAYTPMYPHVEYRSGKDTEKRLDELTKGLPENLAFAIQNNVKDYMDENRNSSGLEYVFLAQQGRKLPIELTPRRYPNISIEEIYKRLGMEYPGFYDSSSYDAYEKLEGEQLAEFNLWLEQYGDQEKINARKEMVARMRAEGKDGAANYLEDRWGEHLSFSAYDSALYRIMQDGRDAGKENYGRTIEKAQTIIDTEGLRPAFEDWLQKEIDKLGYKEVLFAGWTSDGSRRYVPNTIENASRLMNKEGDTNWRDGAGVSETKSVLMPKFRTLNQIRKHKGILESDDEKIKAAYENVMHDWSSLGVDFRDYTKRDGHAYGLDDNPFIAVDNALMRIQEAMTKADPIAYLNREYRYQIPEDNEWAGRIAEMKERIANLPSRYFETKFRRPVYLNEFANAVVPNDLPQDLRDGLANAGLKLYEYDVKDKASRRDATLRATDDDGIRFSIHVNTDNNKPWGDITKDSRDEMESIMNNAISNGTFMKAPNGKRSNLDERQWLQVRTRAFKRWFGDWENDPENASKVLDENGEPMVVFHTSPNAFTVFDKAKIGEMFRNRPYDLGFYFTNDSEMSYGQNKFNVFLNIKDPLQITGEGWGSAVSQTDKRTSDLRRWAKYQNNDGITIESSDEVLVDNSREFTDKVFVAFEPNQIKSATDNNGDFSDENDDIRFAISNQNDDIFYSNAERAVEGIKQEKATPEQWRAMIEKAGGLKAGEDKWIGLSDWLAQQHPTVTPKENETPTQLAQRAQDERKKFTISKQDVLDYIRDNKIQIEEVDYEEGGLNSSMQQRMDEINDEFRELFAQGEEETGSLYYDDYADWAFDAMVERYGDDFSMAFQIVSDSENTRLEPAEDWNGDISDAAYYFLGEGNHRSINETRMDYTTEGLKDKREIALTVPTIEPWEENDNIHFGDAGEGRAIAWARFGDATDEQSNKVLVIDEIQSNRHQEGREHGYRTDEEEKTLQALLNYERELKEKYNKSDFYDVRKLMTDEEIAHRKKLTEANLAAIKNNDAQAVPAAPFEKNWHELAMKRILRFAAENGYDKVAWTTGEQQAARYNLGKQLEAIGVFYNEETGLYDVQVTDKGYDPIEDAYTLEEGLDDEGLRRTIGKDLYNRVMEQGKQDGWNGVVELTGDDLVIGTDGMRGFYDEILPRFMQKYGKKWGATVGEVYLPKLSEGEWENAGNRPQGGLLMHSVDITDAMRESVMEGQPMFSISVRGRDEGTIRPKAMETAMQYAKRVAEKIKHDTPRNTSLDEAIRFTVQGTRVDIDAEYEKAVKSGNDKKIRKLINDAAKIAMPNTKVVDKKGNPLVVYHGTPNKEFFEFNERIGAHFFTNKESNAAEYTTKRGALGVHHSDEGHVVPVYLNLENPLVIDVHGKWDKIDASKVVKTLGYGDVVAGENITLNDGRVIKIWDYNNRTATLTTNGVVALAKDKGYDGVIFKNISDHIWDGDSSQSDVYVAFYPNQIKGIGTQYATKDQWHYPWGKEIYITSKYGATYDNDGNLIPLSKRFDLNNDDIRFSITVNHNSPFLLKRADGAFIDPETGERLGFDHRFMGKGEGGQAHGYGSYFSANDLRDYAEARYFNRTKLNTYKGMLYDEVPKTLENFVPRMILNELGGTEIALAMQYATPESKFAEAVKFVRAAIEYRTDEVYHGLLDDYYRAELADEPIDNVYSKVIRRDPKELAEELLKQLDAISIEDFELARRHHYSVDIPDNTGENYLEEDKQLTQEQVDRLREQAKKDGILKDIKGFLYCCENLEDYPFRKFLSDITTTADIGGAGMTDKEASEFLSRAGFVGIHYDGRRDGECYVIFNPDDAVITDHIRFSVTSGKSVLPKTPDASQVEHPMRSTYNTNGDIVGDDQIRFSVVTSRKKIAELEAGEKIKVYRAAQVIDGKLYPPMAAKQQGQLVKPIELGRWEQAEEHPELAKDGKFKLDKANGSSAVPAAYNPYFHTSRSPLNDQFSSAYDRPNLVTLEVEVPASELTSGYKAEGAKDAVGETNWHSGAVSGKLAKVGEPRKVILSRWDKPLRIVPDAEVAEKIAGMLAGKDIAIPYNVVTPSLRAELEKQGVTISDTPSGTVKKPKENDEIRFSVSYDPRSSVPKVRGGWTKEKILRYLKQNAAMAGTGKGMASRLISEFDSPEELKDHMFYHGTVYGPAALKPSITMSERDAERYGGGGYGDRYWGISLTKDKNIASNFSGTSRSVKIYPVILAKNANVIERPDFSDAYDLEDHIVELWEQGVDAVWIGEGKQGKGEQELCVLNPRAICVIDRADWYDVYNMANRITPLKIVDDEHIEKMYNAALEYQQRKYDKPRYKGHYPMSDEFRVWEIGITPEERAKRRAEYEAALQEYRDGKREFENTEDAKAWRDYEREVDDTIRFAITNAGTPTNSQIITQALIDHSKDNYNMMRAALRDVNSKIKAMSLQRDFDKAQVEELLRLASQLMRANWGNVDSSKYIPHTFDAIARQIRNAVGKEDISKEVGIIMDYITDAQRIQAEKQWKKLLATKAKDLTISGVVGQGKVAVQGQHALEALNGAINSNMTTEQIEDQIAELDDLTMTTSDESKLREYEGRKIGYTIAALYNERVLDLKQERQQLSDELRKCRENTALSRKAKRDQEQAILKAMRENNEQQAEAYVECSSNLQGYINEQHAAAREFVKRIEENREKIRHFANSDLKGAPKNPNTMNTKQGVVRSIYDAISSPIRDLQSLLRMCGMHAPDGEGYLYNHFMRGWTDAADTERLGIMDAQKTLDNKVSELTGGKYKTWEEAARKIKDKSHNKLSVNLWNGEVDDAGKAVLEETPIDAGNALYIYAVNKMTDGKMKLAGMSIDESVVDDLADKVRDMFGQEILDVVDWVQSEYFVQLRNRYNPTHEALFGAPMDAIDNYFPLRINGNARQQNVDLGDPDTDASRLLSGTSTGAIKRRTRNTMPLDVRNADFFQEVIRHIAQMEHWNAFAQWTRDANILFSDKSFRNRIKNMSTIYGSGNALYNYMKDAFKVAAGTYRATGGRIQQGISDVTLNIAKGVTSAKINFRVFTALKQIASFPAFFTYMTDGVFVGSYLRNWLKPHETMKWAKATLPNFEKRVSKRDLGDMRLMQRSTDWQWNKRILELNQKYGMAANVFFDTLTCATGARAVYDSRLADYLKKGYSSDVAESRARQDAEMAFNTSQQSSEGAYMSPVQADRNLVTAALTVFRTSPIQYTRNFMFNTRNLLRKFGRGTKDEQIAFRAKQYERDGLTGEQAAKAAAEDYNKSIKSNVIGFMVYGALLNILWRLAGQIPYLVLGDDDDKKKEIVKDAVTGGALVSPFTGFLGGGNIESMLDGRGSLSGIFAPELPFTQDVKRAEKYLENDKYAEFASMAMSILMQSGTGFDPQTIADIISRSATTINSEQDLDDAEKALRVSQALLSIPQSQYEQMLVDQVIDSRSEYRDALKDYVRYQAVHTAPLTWWLRGDESEDKMEANAKKRFDKLLKERKELRKK